MLGMKSSKSKSTDSRAKARLAEVLAIAQTHERTRIDNVFRAMVSDGRKAGFNRSSDCADAIANLTSFGLTHDDIVARLADAFAARDAQELADVEARRLAAIARAKADALAAAEAARVAKARAEESQRLAEQAESVVTA